MKNTITVKDKKYQLTLKRLIALILIVTFSFSSITPVYANRLGNYGESSAFSQAVSGAYSGAQASSGGSWGDFFSSIATTIIVEAVNLWYYVNYYNDYGKALISFEIGGTRVDISRGQMVRMVASVAANAMVGLVSSQEYRANWESRVIADIWNQVASLMVTEIFRDILVRRFGMDPNFAGIIAGIISQMLCSLVRGEDIINFIKEVDKAEADAKKAEEQKKEVDQAEADAKKAEEQKTEKPATGQKALMKLSKKSDKDESVADSKDSKGKDKEATISFMIKAQALSGTDAAQAKQNIYNKREVEQGLRHAKVMRDSYKSQLNRVNRNPWQLASNRNKKREELERKLEAAENLVGGLSKLQAQLELKPNDAPVTLTLPQLQAARGYLSSPGKASSQPHLPTKIITNIVIGAHRLINSDRADEEKAVLNPPKGSKGYEFTAERIGPKEDNIITIGTKENPIHLNAGKSTEKIEDGRILKGDNGIDYVAIVEPGKDPMFGPVVREIKLQDGTKLSLPNNEPIRGKFKEGQVFNGSDGRDWRVKGTTPDGSASFEPFLRATPVKRELPKLEYLPVPGGSKTSP